MGESLRAPRRWRTTMLGRRSLALRRLPLAAALLSLSLGIGCSSAKPRPIKAPPPVSLRHLWTSPALSGAAGLWDGSFSPDGARVAVALLTGEGANAEHHLWVAGQDSVARLTRGTSDWDPDWSPHSQEVAYLDKSEYYRWQATHEAVGSDALEVGPPPKLTVVDTKTGASRVLKAPDGSYGPPRWSPDGEAIALGAYLIAGEGQMGLMVVDPRGGEARVIPIGDVAPPIRCPVVWSADGKHVLVMSMNALAHTQEIWMADLARRSARCVWSVNGVTGAMMVESDRASGDPCVVVSAYGDLTETATERCTVVRYDRQAKREVEVASLSSARGWLIGVPALGPDGRSLATASSNSVMMVKGAPRKGAILWFRNGQSGREDLPPGVNGSVLAWSRDGRRIAISEWDGKETKIAVYEFSR